MWEFGRVFPKKIYIYTSIKQCIVEAYSTVDIWQNLKIKRNTDYDFPPPLYVGGK